MPTSTSIRPIDESRAARIALATLDNDLVRANRVLVDADEEDAVHLLIAVLVKNLVVAMISPAMSDEGVRKVFERTILDAQQAGNRDD